MNRLMLVVLVAATAVCASACGTRGPLVLPPSPTSPSAKAAPAGDDNKVKPAAATRVTPTPSTPSPK